MIPADYTPLAQSAYMGSSSCFGPWEALTPGQQAKWVKVVVHLATPPQERGRIRPIVIEADKRDALGRMAA